MLVAGKEQQVGKPIKHGKNWRIRWTAADGQRRSEVYDQFRDAAFKLRQHEQEADETRRGLRFPVVPDKTMGDLCDYWLAHRAIKKRSGHHDKSIIECHLRPAFGLLRVRGGVGAQQLDAFAVRQLVEKKLDAKTLSNHLTLLGSLFVVGTELRWLRPEEVPKIHKPRIRLFNHDYRWLRTDDELKRFLRAAKDEGDNVLILYLTALYTGMREGELAGLLWDRVNFERRLITVDHSFAGMTKSEDVRYVPILDTLLPVLKAWRLRCPGRLVFPNRAGEMHAPSARIFQEVLHRILDGAELPLIERKGKMVRYIVFHDLRHTFASHWMMRGGDIFKVQRILGHKSVQMTMRYAHLAPNAFEADLDRFGPALDLDDAEVVAFPVPSIRG